jgi:Bacterial transcriptional activator domain
LRERTHRLLMVALHQSGRQAEALRTYQDYRRRLATDLGLEPGERIRQLDAAIGASDLPTDVVRRRHRRKVARRTIRPVLADREDVARSSEADAQLVVRLERRHVVPLSDDWREPGGAHLVMRLLLGSSAHRWPNRPATATSGRRAPFSTVTAAAS